MKLSVSKLDSELSETRQDFFDGVAEQYLSQGPLKRYYNEYLYKAVRFNVVRGSTVLEIGCGVGDLLAALEPRRGVGIDFSERMISLAKERHSHLDFRVMDAHALDIDEKFDYVVLSNLVGDLVDVQQVFTKLPLVCHDRTRVVITHYNYLWGPLIRLAERMGIKPRQREQNWLEIESLENLLELADIEPVKRGRHILSPIPIPVVADLVNDYVGTLPLFRRFCVNELVVGRPRSGRDVQDYFVSVIVACKNEKGNIEELIRAIPKMGLGTELIFVDGRSTDGTVEEIERCISIIKEINPKLEGARLLVQTGVGKGDAVRMGFDEAKGEVLMILDADITVRPEDLSKFYYALIDGKGEFINGSRLVYPMEDEAMRFLNMLANHLFSWTFTWLLDQRLTDTLCGTKVLFKRDYEKIKESRSFFGDFDPFGDFDLLFGAAKQNLKIREIPIRYRNREYGEIKIDRFRHGWLLLKMSALAYKWFKLNRGSY